MKKKSLLLLSFAIFVLILSGCATKVPPGEEWLKSPGHGGGETVCLDEDIAETGLGQTLPDIPRPIADPATEGKADNMYPTPLHDMCSPPDPPEEACAPDVADYILVATDVKVGQIFLGPDRLIAKQFSTADSPFPDEYIDIFKDRLYRAFCGDWCYSSSLSEGYRGTFYCNFILYLKSNDANSNPLLGNPADSQLPPDDSIFDIYFRKGAEIPEKIKCKDGQAAAGIQAEATGRPGFFINFDNARWFFREEGSVKKKDVMKEKPEGPRWLMGTTEIPELGTGTFRMYVDLLFDAPQEDEEGIIYAVGESEAEKIDDPSVDGQERITYYEFQKAEEWKPGGKTLQLGTFKPPITAGWFKTWLTESKPAIYLYPEKPIKVDVKLNPAGQLTVSKPQYPPGGWQGVVAYPDGRLEYQGRSYPYLYYEADLKRVFVEKEGFVVKGSDLVTFFKETLPQVGLSRWETADFIQYWMGRLDRNQPYYFIHFLSKEQIEELEPLTLSVKPDTEIRVRPYFKPLDEPIEIKTQVLGSPSERKGFTIVEWGGILDKSKIKNKN